LGAAAAHPPLVAPEAQNYRKIISKYRKIISNLYIDESERRWL
jgi:hypothetical protein